MILDRFNAAVPAPQAVETLMEAVLGNPSVPNTFLCLAALNGTACYRVYVLHTLSKYTPTLDGNPTPWDNCIFGFLGDVLKNTTASVIIPNTAFSIVQGLEYNEAQFTAELSLLPQGDLFPRLAANNQDGVPILTHYLMFIPTEYAPLLLDNKGYTLQEA
jgi:hypothetical protein